MPPAARINDLHVCPMVTVLVPHVGGPIMVGHPTVIVGGQPQARVGDMAVCVGPPDMIAQGSMGVMVGGVPAARMGDLTAHGGTIAMGHPTVMIGDFGGGAPSPGNRSMVVPGMGAEGQAADQAAMAEIMIQAARDGVAFCEQCMRGA